MNYIYIDESGDLGEKPSSSKYFVIGAIMVDNPKYLNRLIKNARRKYNNIIGRDVEIKGNKTNRQVIKKILRKVNNIDCEVLAIFLDKFIDLIKSKNIIEVFKCCQKSKFED
ncbi:DUF3800 domain-containing protein [Methanobrevibacter sp. UBA188]|jgi:hypothetical protein|uniref:DUF3800 domain-containing protein n=1 Tax=Methanobrevibacter sp. UBA188 TaxID=1915473 RepID=UPI0025EAA62C|nr:DUF3800 domain-containing protein [Methanobrevibacter sp. UBA188]